MTRFDRTHEPADPSEVAQSPEEHYTAILTGSAPDRNAQPVQTDTRVIIYEKNWEYNKNIRFFQSVTTRVLTKPKPPRPET